MKILPRLRSMDDDGGTMVEFGVGIAVLSCVMFGILDCSRAIYIRHFLESASWQASRYAMVRGSYWKGASCSTAPSACMATSADVEDFVRADVPPGVMQSNLSVNTTWPGTAPSGVPCNNYAGNNSQGCIVTVTVSYNFSFLFSFLPVGNFPLASTSTVTISR